MAAPVPSSPIPRTYVALRQAVEAAVLAGRRSIDEAWLRTYHEAGRLIHGHFLLQGNRADYAAQTFARLAKETEISSRTLHECVQFYRCFPIVRPGAQLAWTDYRLLCQVSDPNQRAALLVQLEKSDWKKADLEARVRALNAGSDPASRPANPPAAKAAVKILRPRRGTPDLFRVVARDGGRAVDVGFKLYLPLAPAQSRGLSPGDFVQTADTGEFVPAKNATVASLFTYAALVRRVIDGDTLAVTIALPGWQMDEKLRLRGLDCPELDTPEGRAAKRFTESLLLDAAGVIVTTSKVDKYDRYLADVHVRRPGGEEIFLNNALLENGHALPMGAEEMTDWTP